jgi:hypothetical protein
MMVEALVYLCMSGLSPPLLIKPLKFDYRGIHPNDLIYYFPKASPLNTIVRLNYHKTLGIKLPHEFGEVNLIQTKAIHVSSPIKLFLWLCLHF